MTLGIVQQLGGRIVGESRSNDATGARFTVTLPIDGAAVVDPGERGPRTIITTPSSSAIMGDPAHPPRVLIIDDEPSIRAALRRFFARRGWQVEEAEDGAEGLSMILTAKFDFAVVISDLKMPGCSGVELPHCGHRAVGSDHLPRMWHLSRRIYDRCTVLARSSQRIVPILDATAW